MVAAWSRLRACVSAVLLAAQQLRGAAGGEAAAGGLFAPGAVAALYDGSWSEYGTADGVPIETGPPSPPPAAGAGSL